MKIVVDTSVLVGLVNPRDLWRGQALGLRDRLLSTGADMIYFDCVVAETVSAATRRLREKNRVADITAMLDQLSAQVLVETITWIMPDIPRLYPAVLDLVRSFSGELNFNDALIALACRERGIDAIASFDADFDRVTWLRRLAHPEDVTS